MISYLLFITICNWVCWTSRKSLIVEFLLRLCASAKAEDMVKIPLGVYFQMKISLIGGYDWIGVDSICLFICSGKKKEELVRFQLECLRKGLTVASSSCSVRGQIWDFSVILLLAKDHTIKKLDDHYLWSIECHVDIISIQRLSFFILRKTFSSGYLSFEFVRS